VVDNATEGAKQVVDQAPPEASPITTPIDQTLDTISGACNDLPICP
jgi:hypothetical protein